MTMMTVACAGTDLSTKRIEQTETIKPVSDILVILVADKDETRSFF